jgi:hypothetical protein
MVRVGELIQKGQTFNFRNNAYTVSHGTYTRASNELLGWAATVEDFIRNNYGDDSAAFRLYQTFYKRKLNGFEEDDFNEQMANIMGDLLACKQITSRKKNRLDIAEWNHQISFSLTKLKATA